MRWSVLQIFECQKSMDRPAKLAGVRRITHHDLRPLFATRCIQSRMDIPCRFKMPWTPGRRRVVMKTYGHLRDEHSANESKKVAF
jgi:integrase